MRWSLVIAILCLGCGFDASGHGQAGEVSATGGGGVSSTETSMTNANSQTSAGTASGTATSDTTSSTATTTGPGDSTTTSASGSGPNTDTAGPTGGGGFDCAVDNGGCDPNALCEKVSDVIVCTCDPGFMGNGEICEVDAVLPVVRLDVPCQSNTCGSRTCVTPNSVSSAEVMSGSNPITYDVTIRVRGVVELRGYNGGTTTGYWNDGGTPDGSVYNAFALEVSDPARTYYLNAGEPGNAWCVGLDYQQTIEVRGGATVRVSMSDVNNCTTMNLAEGSDEPIIVPGIPPAPGAFDGQFVQLDAVSIAPQ